MTKRHNGEDLLEQSIISTLKSAESSAEIGELIAKVERSIAEAEQEARDAERTATDIEASPGGPVAFARAQEAHQRHSRLVAVLPKLQARYAEVSEQEYSAQWVPEYREVKAERDAFVADFTQQVTSAINQIVDLLNRAQQVNQQISHVNVSAPAGDGRRIETIDLRFSNELRFGRFPWSGTLARPERMEPCGGRDVR